ncbi:MAG: hypothetical protein ACLVJB_01230 [Christensenellales bacterium]
MDGMRLLGTRRVSGRASIWLTAGETLLLCDALSECIFARNGGGQWSLFCEHAQGSCGSFRERIKPGGEAHGECGGGEWAE